MQFTRETFIYFAKGYSSLGKDSIFHHFQETLSEAIELKLIEELVSSGVLASLASPEPVEGMRAVLDILAYPDRSAHFSLQSKGQQMRKAVFAKGDRRILLEFLERDIMVSIYDSEAESVRQEISNQTGVSFQKPTQFNLTMTCDQISVFLAAIDLHRYTALADWLPTSSDKATDPHVKAETLKESLLKNLRTPHPKGVYARLKPMLGLDTFNEETLDDALRFLGQNGFTEPNEHFSPLMKTLCEYFLIPDIMISLELSQPPLVSKELILQGHLKQALSFSVSEACYSVESITGVEILNHIDAYLSCPILG